MGNSWEGSGFFSKTRKNNHLDAVKSQAPPRGWTLPLAAPGPDKGNGPHETLSLCLRQTRTCTSFWNSVLESLCSLERHPRRSKRICTYFDIDQLWVGIFELGDSEVNLKMFSMLRFVWCSGLSCGVRGLPPIAVPGTEHLAGFLSRNRRGPSRRPKSLGSRDPHGRPGQSCWLMALPFDEWTSKWKIALCLPATLLFR